MMRGRLGVMPLVVALAALVSVGLVTLAVAKPVKISGVVAFDRFSDLPEPSSAGDSAVYGHVVTRQACLAKRKVVIVGTYTVEGRLPYDTATTGSHGGFSGVGFQTVNGHGLQELKLTLKPKSIGTKRHPEICKGDTETIGFA